MFARVEDKYNFKAFK